MSESENPKAIRDWILSKCESQGKVCAVDGRDGWAVSYPDGTAEVVKGSRKKAEKAVKAWAEKKANETGTIGILTVEWTT